MIRRFSLLSVVLVAVWLITLPAVSFGDDGPATTVDGSSLLFVENAGQWDDAARFQVRGGRGALWLADDALWLTLLAGEQEDTGAEEQLDESSWLPQTGVHLKITFSGANPDAHLEPFGRLETKLSYFTGNDPAGWRAAVPVWSGVRYIDLYPGWNLEITSQNGQLAWRLVGAQPAAPLPDARLRVEGADSLNLEDGALRLATAAGEATLPLIQLADGSQPPAAPIITGNEVRFPLSPCHLVTRQQGGENDLRYSTFLGGSLDDSSGNVAVDRWGNATIAANTYSSNFPTTPGVFDPSHNGSQDAVVAKVNNSGNALEYATYLGGGNADNTASIAVDGEGFATIFGETQSSNFPATAGAYDTTYNGGPLDAYVAKLNSDGTALVYATYLGASEDDYADSVALDSDGRAIVTSYTDSSNFPTTPGAYDTSFNGGLRDAYVARLSADGRELEYSTFLGGDDGDLGRGIALGEDGSFYVVGYTKSGDFPTTGGAYDGSHNGGVYDAFVAQFTPDGRDLDYSTFLGGGNYDRGWDVAADSGGHAYVVGATASSSFPTTGGAFDTTHNGSDDVFVTKLNPAGSGLVYSTFIGGGAFDGGYEIALRNGEATISGETFSASYPTTADAYDQSFNGSLGDAMFSHLNAGGDDLLYSTFLGGTNADSGPGLFVDTAGHVTLSGWTDSSNFPTSFEAFDTGHNGSLDAYAARFTLGAVCGAGFDIPDDDPAGASTSVTISDANTLNDLDVRISAEHTFVGDLIFTLTHDDTGTSVDLIHRPGGPPRPYCERNDIEATLDDEANDPAEDECNVGAPAIDGVFTPAEPLSAFDVEQFGGTWTLTAADVAANDVGEVLEWCLLPTLDPEPVTLVKTVGTDPNTCTATDFVDVHPGDEVTYCYEITNHSPLALTTHDLVDDRLGVILDDYAYDLEPGASTFVTVTAVAATTITNTATWTASVVDGPAVAASDSATVYVVPIGCSMPLLAIPDDDLTGVSDDVILTGGGEITDMDITIQAEHTFVGDLVFTVEHVDTGTAVTLIDRPGGPPAPYCSGDDIDATLDDEATEPVENECDATPPTIDGVFAPNFPLSAFDGEALSGTWRLRAADIIANDVGTLTMWCVQATAGSAAIVVEPPALESTQAPDTVVVLPLTVSNEGGANLTWSITDDADWAGASPTAGTTAPGDSTVVDVTFDATGLEEGNYVGTLTIESNDPLAPVVVVPLTLNVGCVEDCLRSTGIRLIGRSQGGNTGVIGRVRVTDENGDAVAEAAVFTEWTVTLAGETTTIILPVDITDANGIARFALVSGPGTYTLTVADMVKPGYTFDPANSILSATIEVLSRRGVE